MRSRPTALVVSEDSCLQDRWCAWLEQTGFLPLTCPGPHVVWSCPRLDGLPCPRRELADVALVELGWSDNGELYGGNAVRSCTKLPDDGRTVFVRFSAEPVGAEEGAHISSPVTPAQLTAAAWAAYRKTRTFSRSRAE